MILGECNVRNGRISLLLAEHALDDSERERLATYLVVVFSKHICGVALKNIKLVKKNEIYFFLAQIF